MAWPCAGVAPGNNLNLNRATMSHVPCRGLSAWAGGALERSAAGRARRRRRVLERRERAVRGARGPRSPAVSTTAVRRLCGGAPPHRRGPNAPAPGTARPEGTTPPRDTRIHLVCSADCTRWCLTVRVEGSCAPGAVGRHLLHLHLFFGRNTLNCDSRVGPLGIEIPTGYGPTLRD